MLEKLDFSPLDRMLFLFWPGDGNSYTVDMLQQPHGFPGSSEDQKGTGCHSYDGGHQHESCADNHQSVQPGGGCVVASVTPAFTILYFTNQCFSLSADFTQGLPHWPITRQDTKHPGSDSREVHPVSVQPLLQDPPVAHVLVCCHAARRSQLAVPQYYCSTGTGHRWHAGTVNPFTLTFRGVYRLKISLLPHWRFNSHLTGGTWTFHSLLWP